MRAGLSSLLLFALSIANLSLAFPANSESTSNLGPRQSNDDDLDEGQQCAGDKDGSSFNAYACVWVQRDTNSKERIRVRYAIKNLSPSNDDPSDDDHVYASYTVYWEDDKNHESPRLKENDPRQSRKKGWKRYDRNNIDVTKVRITACIEKGDPDKISDDDCEHKEIFLEDFRERNF